MNLARFPTFGLTVDAPPVRASVDPYNKLVDRDSDDYVRRVDLDSTTGTRPVGAPQRTAG